MMKQVLIVGLGISGMATAIALHKQGFAVKIIERASERRTGGYFLGLQKEGREAAKHLGVLDNIHFRDVKEAKTWEVLEDGSRIHLVDFADLLVNPTFVLRGDVEAGLWQAVKDLNNVEIVFGTTITAVKNIENQQVTATLKTGETEFDEIFDLVVGADGMRSTVRKLAFGTDEHFMKPFNKMLCAFQLNDEVKSFSQKDGFFLAEPNRMLYVMPLSDHKPVVLMMYNCQDINAQFKRPVVEVLREVYAGMQNSEIVDEILEDLASTHDFLFDSVNMVKMPKWVNGRIMLLGDSAWCMTLYSGMGVSGGLYGADTFGQMIAKYQDLDKAITEWEKIMRPFVRKNQFLASIRQNIAVPPNEFALNARRIGLRLLGLHLRHKKEK